MQLLGLMQVWYIGMAWYTSAHTYITPKPLVFARALASAETTQPPVFVRMHDQNGHGSDRSWLSSEEVVWKNKGNYE